MSQAVPSKNELTKAIIINTISTALGIVIGIAFNTWWDQHKTRSNSMENPSMNPLSGGTFGAVP